MSRDDHFQDITIAGSVSLGAQSKVEGNLIPDTDDERTLGDATHKWKAIYVTSATLTGTSGLTASSHSVSFTASVGANMYLVTTGASTIVATLPTAASLNTETIFIKKIDSGAGTVVLTPNGAETIDGLSTFTLSSQFQYVGVVSDGVAWQIFTRN